MPVQIAATNFSMPGTTHLLKVTDQQVVDTRVDEKLNYLSA
jgi:hypothetical protein